MTDDVVECSLLVSLLWPENRRNGKRIKNSETCHTLGHKKLVAVGAPVRTQFSHTTITCPETPYLSLTLNCQFSFPIRSQRLQSPIDCLGLPTLMPPSHHFLIHSSSLSGIVSSHLARSTRSPSPLLHSVHLPQ